MACSDPYLTYLKEAGYNVVRLPKADVRPGQILTRNGKNLTRLGDLSDVLSGGNGAPFPKLLSDGPVADLSGRKSGELSFGVGLSLLGTIIGALGGSKVGLDVKYERAKTVVFEFLDVLEDRLEIVALDKFLAGADVNPASSYVRELLFADEIYVTTAVVKSARLSVEGKTSDQTAVELSVPAVQQLVGANVKVSAKGESASKITYEGSIPLSFGFQAVQLDYEKGRYRRFKHVGAGDVGLERLETAAAAGRDRESVLLATRAPFVDLQG